MRPIISWTGGKRRLLKDILPLLKPNELYIEPFIGGGAVFFELLESGSYDKFIVNDINLDLIGFYKMVKSDVSSLINNIADLRREYEKSDNRREFFLKVRSDFNNGNRTPQLFYFLMRTCFNALYRVNSKNAFNTPYETNKKVFDIPADDFYKASELFNKRDVKFENLNIIDLNEKYDFLNLLNTTIYFDPPYVDVESSGEVKYSSIPFDFKMQEYLATLCQNLKCDWLLSNSDHISVRDLYKSFANIKEVEINRLNGSKVNTRKKINELLIYKKEV